MWLTNFLKTKLQDMNFSITIMASNNFFPQVKYDGKVKQSVKSC